MRCQYSKVVHRILFLKRKIMGQKRLRTTDLNPPANFFNNRKSISRNTTCPQYYSLIQVEVALMQFRRAGGIF